MSIKFSFEYGENEYCVLIAPHSLGFQMQEGEELHARANLEIVSTELRQVDTFADRLKIIDEIRAEVTIG